MSPVKTKSKRAKQLGFRVPAHLHKKIRAAAEKEQRSINQWLILHFEAYFQPKGKR